MSNSTSNTSQWEKGVANSTKKLAIWTGAWLVSCAVATFGSILVWESSIALKIISIGVNFAIGLGAIRANIHHIQSLDEMMQKVHLQAMGIAMGISIVAGISYSQLDISDVIPFDAEIGHLVALTGLVYGISTMLGLRRYQ